MFNVPLLVLAVSILTRILSTDVWSRAQFTNASVKSVAVTVSKRLAGKVVKLLQPFHALEKLVPALTSISGKLVKLAEPDHV